MFSIGDIGLNIFQKFFVFNFFYFFHFLSAFGQPFFDLFQQSFFLVHYFTIFQNLFNDRIMFPCTATRLFKLISGIGVSATTTVLAAGPLTLFPLTMILSAAKNSSIELSLVQEIIPSRINSPNWVFPVFFKGNLLPISSDIFRATGSSAP